MPVDFVKRHLIKQPAGGNVILRGPNGGTWSVKLKCEIPKYRLQNGWLAFVRDNDLKVGDVCVFILIKDIKLSFDVVFFRGTEAANFRLSPGIFPLP